MTEHANGVSGADRNLVRAIGTWGLAASIVNVTVGGGIFRLPASPDLTGRLGAAAPLAYVACAIVMLLIVLCIAEAGSRVSLTGGPYAYVEVTFGRFAGFLVGVMLFVVGCTAMPAVAGMLADAAARLVPIIVQSVLTWILAMTNGFESLVILSNVSVSMVYLGCAAAAWKLRTTQPVPGAFRVPGGAIVPVLAAAAILFLLSSVTLKEWSVLAVVVVAAAPLYFIAGRSGLAAGRNVAFNDPDQTDGRR